MDLREIVQADAVKRIQMENGKLASALRRMFPLVTFNIANGLATHKDAVGYFYIGPEGTLCQYDGQKRSSRIESPADVELREIK